MKTYQDVVSYLESFLPKEQYRYPKELGLARMRELLRILGDPHLKYATIHIVGTAGKGSTATILAQILATAGYKTGLHISPHLQVIPERMQINGRFIQIPKLIDVLETIIKPAIERLSSSDFGLPSYYEVFWATTFAYFNQEKVDIAVVEAGLGGTWDGTLVLSPIVGILTNVGLDHTEILGRTVEEIARDKAGVVRKGITIVSGVKQESVKEIVGAKSKEQRAKLLLLGRDFDYKIVKLSDLGTTFHFNDLNHYRTIANLELSLVGKHQVENAAIAIAAFIGAEKQLKSTLSTLGSKTPLDSEKVIRTALATVKVPGRLETVQDKPRVILDGAHNPAKMSALVEALPLFPGKTTRIGVVAFKKDKDIRNMLKILLPMLDHLIITEFSVTIYMGKRWSEPAEGILQLVEALERKKNTASKSLPLQYEVELDAIKAVRRALALAEKEDTVLVTGSLYLVGEVRELWYPEEKLLLEQKKEK